MPTFLVRPFLLAFLFFIYSSLLRYTHVSWTPIFRVPRRLRMALTTYAYRRTLTRSTSYIIYIYVFFAVILSRQSSFYLGAAAAASSSFPRSHFTTDPEDCLGFPRASDLHPRDQSPPLSSLLSLVLFYFPSFLKIYLSLELVVENMKRLRSGECWALVDKSSRIRGVKVLEGEREKTALSPSFVLFLSFFSSSSFHSAHVLHYLQLFHLFLISYNFRV